MLAAAAMLGAMLWAGVAWNAPAAGAQQLPSQSGPTAGPKRPPVLAYYYMWFNSKSWTHNKSDLPLLGAYDSTDPRVIAQHVAWAKDAGIDGFIVSWKDTPNLDKALAELVAECQKQGLKLVLIYEGLDVQRNPIAATTVAADIGWFLDRYGSDPVFDLYGKPAVIWSGTWKFPASDIESVRARIGAPDRVLLLGSEKDAKSYAARAGLFDGDAYYWSSADPLKTPGYRSRLVALGQAVHADKGLWLAPAAVGFDGPQNGGTIVVDRRNGATLTSAWQVALATEPDAVAVISWNEFTEASFVEPSQAESIRYLQVLAALTGATLPADLSATLTPLPPLPSGAGPVATSSGRGGIFGSLTRNPPVDPGGASVFAALAIFALIGLLGLGMRRRGRNALERASKYE